MEMIEVCMTKNLDLGRYDFRYNMITTDGKCEDSYGIQIRALILSRWLN